MEGVPRAETLKDDRSNRERVKEFLIGKPYEAPAPSLRCEQPAEGRIGICFSGGGIRSAAYNLGALQVLQESQGNGPPLFNRATYISAVSGGSYIAASHAIVRGQSDPALFSQLPAYARGSPEEQFLRNHCSYLAPGAKGKVNLTLRFLLGLVVNLGLVALALFIFARPLGWLYAEWLHQGLKGRQARVHVSFGMWLVILIPFGMSILAYLVDLLFRPGEKTHRFLLAWSTRLLVPAVLAFLFLVAVPFAIEFVRNILAPVSEAVGVAEEGQSRKTQGALFLRVLGFIFGTGIVAGSIRAFVAKNRSIFAKVVAAVVAPLALVALFLLFVNDAAFAGTSERQFTTWWMAVALFIILYAWADLTSWSIHPFYRRRLSSAFSIQRCEDPKTGEITAREINDDLPRLSKSAIPDYPELIICGAANVSDAGATPPGRSAASFTFTAAEVGGPVMGTVPTAEFEDALGARRRRDFTLPIAVGISGAAVSPSMGKMSRGWLRFLLALANVRLGVWLPNPQWINRWKTIAARDRMRGGMNRAIYMRPRPRYLLREALGWNRLRDKFLYVTDGGHYENLGLVELLRRGCTEIYCFDASGDKDDTFFTLGEAIEIARADLQVEIDIRPQPLKPDKETRRAERSHVVGTIDYPDGSIGRLVFVKATVTEDCPWDVKAFHERDKRFPNHPTLDQFFNEQKFEAYRALGAYAALAAVLDKTVLVPDRPTTRGDERPRSTVASEQPS